MVETVTLPKDELFAMLDIADEMVRFCSVQMPADRYHAVSGAVWVIAHRAAGNNAEADRLKAEMLSKRAAWIASRSGEPSPVVQVPQNGEQK